MSHKPIRISIRKKTLVPVNGIVHKFRSDWKQVGNFGYHQTPYIFNSINPNSRVKTDAHFAKFLKDNYGEGTYMVLAWKKGREGFWNFMMVVCGPETFMRLPKKETKEQKDMKQNRADYLRIKDDLKNATDEDEKQQIREQSEDILDEYEFNKEMGKIDQLTIKRGPAGYLKSTMPLFREHEYEDFVPEEERDLINRSFI